LKKILNVSLLNKYGFKISRIDKMTDTEINDRILALNQNEAQPERVINELIQYMIDLDMVNFENTLSNYIAARGIERTLMQIIFPYMERIGILWVTNHINPAQEHLVTNIIRQKIILGIENTSPVLQSKKTVLLFLPEGEYHELGILFLHYLVKSRGANVLYLGTGIPVKDVAFVAELKKPDYMYSHLTNTNIRFDLQQFMLRIQKNIPGIPLVLSGRLCQDYSGVIPENIRLNRSVAETMAFINTL
jgi:methanogenic corrinoid protein MtbC1